MRLRKKESQAWGEFKICASQGTQNLWLNQVWLFDNSVGAHDKNGWPVVRAIQDSQLGLSQPLELVGLCYIRQLVLSELEGGPCRPAQRSPSIAGVCRIFLGKNTRPEHLRLP